MMLEIEAEIGHRRGHALHAVRLSVAPGEAVLVRGPNGVGKSTLLATIAGLRRPLAGTVRVDGSPTARAAVKRSIGYVTDPPTMFEELSPSEHLHLVASLWRAARVNVSFDGDCGRLLDGVPDLPARMLSLGQRKRLAIRQAVLHEPWLWVFDEPFNGLDADAGAIVSDLVSEHLERGGAVIGAAHGDAAGLCATRIVDLESTASVAA